MTVLSVLDHSPIRDGGTATQAINESIELAKHVENLGYHRFWVSEHHNHDGLAGVSPEILMTRIASATDSIRVGSGGVMLPYYSPLKVAENCKLMEAMFPNRIDLGVGRAPGSDAATANAMVYGGRMRSELFPAMTSDLAELLQGKPPKTAAFSAVRATPMIETVPELWMLGTSESSAMLAAELGLPYNFAYVINAEIRSDILDIYREHFKPSAVLEKPLTSMAVFVICAETEEEAQYLAASRDLWYVRFAQYPLGKPVPTPEEASHYPYSRQEMEYVKYNRKQMMVGTPEQVKDKLLSFQKHFGCDELMIVTVTHDFEARKKSYEMLAEVFELNGK